ncbi:MAG TPA: alpha/beta hydrolase [Terriglobia bacterium]|nr:alpha/beta hydrolase [Terriglobia bacterium]
MTSTTPVHASDLVGFSRLALDATAGLADLVEAMHSTIARAPGILDRPAPGPANGTAGLVYETVRAVTRLVGGGVDAIFGPVIHVPGGRHLSPEREAVLAALNGVMGDYLAATDNPLAISMRLRRNGRPLTLERKALAAATPKLTSKLLVLVHGLCMNDLQWTRDGHNHGKALARELGFAPVHLHYNTGLHVSANGRAFADLMEALVKQWPVPLRELAIVAHSVGGLVSRSAYYYGTAAGHLWSRHLRKLVFLGTPHHGSVVERGGNWVNVMLGLSPYSEPLARPGKIRSAGITDLRYGNLLDEDWEGIDRFEHSGDLRHPVPLPKGVRCYTIAATTGKKVGNRFGELLGDGLVPLNSALGRHKDPRFTLSFAKSREWVGYGMNHWDLLSHPAVYKQIRHWLASES